MIKPEILAVFFWNLLKTCRLGSKIIRCCPLYLLLLRNMTETYAGFWI